MYNQTLLQLDMATGLIEEAERFTKRNRHLYTDEEYDTVCLGMNQVAVEIDLLRDRYEDAEEQEAPLLLIRATVHLATANALCTLMGGDK